MSEQHPLPARPLDGDFSSNRIPEPYQEDVTPRECDVCGASHPHYKFAVLRVGVNYQEPCGEAEISRVQKVYICPNENCRSMGVRFADRPLTATIRKRSNA